MRIRPALPSDFPAIQEVERAAGAAFREVGMDAVAGDEPADLPTLERYRRHGGAWVLVAEPEDAFPGPLGYLLCEPVDGALHIEQVSVHPERARRGLGARLVEHAVEGARAAGRPAVTLTTFRDVPWNAPYYARLGFRPLEAAHLTPGLRRIRAHEAGLGLDRWPRLAMCRTL